MELKIPLLRPYFDSEELEEIQKVLDSGWVSQGPKVKEFEDKIAEYLGVKYAIAVTNCTAALHLALLSIGVKKGDEVLVADYTFPATGHAVLYCGAKTVFCDADSKTYNINPELIEEKISDKTKAVHSLKVYSDLFMLRLTFEIRTNSLRCVAAIQERQTQVRVFVQREITHLYLPASSHLSAHLALGIPLPYPYKLVQASTLSFF